MQWIFSLQELPGIAKEILTSIGEKKVVSLAGKMGSGKTTLVHAFCDALKVTGAVGSPTFAIINEYPAQSGPVYHVDCYRLRDEQEAIDAGVEDCLFSGEWCFVEWPEKIPHLFPQDTVRMNIRATSDGKRILERLPSNDL